MLGDSLILDSSQSSPSQQVFQTTDSMLVSSTSPPKGFSLAPLLSPVVP